MIGLENRKAQRMEFLIVGSALIFQNLFSPWKTEIKKKKKSEYFISMYDNATWLTCHY